MWVGLRLALALQSVVFINGSTLVRKEAFEAGLLDDVQMLDEPPKQTVDMFVALSDMFPKERGECPYLAGYSNSEFKAQSEVKFCANMLSQAQAEGTCLVYNFGVARTDPFLEKLTSDYPGCQVYGFDPFVHESELMSHFGKNFTFRSWGLWNGESSQRLERTTSDKKKTKYEAKFMSLRQIQKELGHEGKRISIMRSDCEGCEWGWVPQAMREDPRIFSRIDQMFIEIHVVKVQGMDHSDSVWKEGLPPKAPESVPAVYNMIANSFHVMYGRVNPGMPMDRRQVPEWLTKRGVLSEPCCREYTLINKRFGSSHDAKSSALSLLADAGQARPVLDPRVAEKFKAGLNRCPSVEKATKVGRIKYCADILRAHAASKEGCYAHVFGASSPDEVSLIRKLAADFPKCVIMVFDPARTDAEIRSISEAANIRFHPWGFYAGFGPRVVQQGGKSLEYYRLPEIWNSWTARDKLADSEASSPLASALLYADWRQLPQQTWVDAVQEQYFNWYGFFRGLDAIGQLCG
eukprot:TRINITY_DN71791_c0_g1_i1.p1 TRINITY_DN71791_c0_g1~~TRINITY_DN71791_c0_g1_i1.p1  ORF type:complete len:536 (-),score=114.68 TRINITY_DN71791_c0_g1_i1:94-1653(-)